MPYEGMEYGRIAPSILVCGASAFILVRLDGAERFKYAIPFVSALISKVLVGDWDKGYQWSSTDVLYWTVLIGVGACVIFMTP